MKYHRFLAKYPVSKVVAGAKPILSDSVASIGIEELPLAIYLNGLYTIVTRDEASRLTKLAESIFPMASGKIAVYAVDWMGRLFATDTSTPDSIGAATVACFDFAEPSSFTTQANFEDFHNVVAIDMMAELFNMEQFTQWTSKNAPPNDETSCIGYKVPLFLGGQDNQDNMERMDRSVYLHMLSELWSSATNLPSGSVVNQIDFE